MIAKIEKYAFAVRDGANLFLFLWVKRSAAGDFYVFLPRPHNPKINAHASYHVDGRYHVKSHGHNKIMDRQKQKPDQTFAGTEHLLDQRIDQASPRSIGKLCDQSEWSGVFEILTSEIRPGTHYTHVSADLISRGYQPNFVPNAKIVRQCEFRNSTPFIVLTLYEMPHGG
jgi:hypothetical protein